MWRKEVHKTLVSRTNDLARVFFLVVSSSVLRIKFANLEVFKGTVSADEQLRKVSFLKFQLEVSRVKDKVSKHLLRFSSQSIDQPHSTKPPFLTKTMVATKLFFMKTVRKGNNGNTWLSNRKFFMLFLWTRKKTQQGRRKLLKCLVLRNWMKRSSALGGMERNDVGWTKTGKKTDKFFSCNQHGTDFRAWRNGTERVEAWFRSAPHLSIHYVLFSKKNINVSLKYRIFFFVSFPLVSIHFISSKELDRKRPKFSSDPFLVSKKNIMVYSMVAKRDNSSFRSVCIIKFYVPFYRITRTPYNI